MKTPNWNTYYYADGNTIHQFKARPYGKHGELKADSMLRFLGYATIIPRHTTHLIGDTPEKAVELFIAETERKLVNLRAAEKLAEKKIEDAKKGLPIVEYKDQ